jgi:hypothetical protein
MVDVDDQAIDDHDGPEDHDRVVDDDLDHAAEHLHDDVSVHDDIEHAVDVESVLEFGSGGCVWIGVGVVEFGCLWLAGSGFDGVSGWSGVRPGGVGWVDGHAGRDGG